MTKSPLLRRAGGFFRCKDHHKPDCCGQSGLWFPECHGHNQQKSVHKSGRIQGRRYLSCSRLIRSDSKRVLRATFA